MSEGEEGEDQTPQFDPATPPKSFGEFLQNAPIGEKERVSGVFESIFYRGGGRGLRLCEPLLYTYCESKTCEGQRHFAMYEQEGSASPVSESFLFLKYRCRDCQRTEKIYAIHISNVDEKDENISQLGATVQKYGSIPRYETHFPSRILRLLGPDQGVFFKGWQCESDGLGIGAFAYYRRIIERQKDRLLKEIRKVAAKQNSPQELLDDLDNAIAEKRFSEGIERMKAGVPIGLEIDGQNPLLLLHDALSQGLHAEADDECLEIAIAIRRILFHVAETTASVLADHKELSESVAKLLQKRRQRGGNT